MTTQTFTPTQKMAVNAKRGLKLRDKFGRGGTQVGVKRAHQLADRKDVSEKDVKSMASYFARHRSTKAAEATAGTAMTIRPPASSHGCYGAATRASVGRKPSGSPSTPDRPW